LRKIPIVHVYGQLSRHPYPDQEARPYTAQNDVYKLIGYAARGITLLHDKAKPEIEAAHELLRTAQRICFLGFGYHPLNLQRLKAANPLFRRVVFGTSRGLIGEEVNEVQAGLFQTMLTPAITLNDADNLVVLRQHLILG
jgi:hypothetical protein